MTLSLIDLETTGLDPMNHEIIDLALLTVDKDTLEIKDKYQTKIKPAHIETASFEALRVNGYNDADWSGAPSLDEVLDIMTPKLRNTYLTAYNVAFDAAFMDEAYRSSFNRPKPYKYHKIDILTLAVFMGPELQSYKLKNVCEALNMQPEPPIHTAMNGAMCAYEVLKRLTQKP